MLVHGGTKPLLVSAHVSRADVLATEFVWDFIAANQALTLCPQFDEQYISSSRADNEEGDGSHTSHNGHTSHNSQTSHFSHGSNDLWMWMGQGGGGGGGG